MDSPQADFILDDTENYTFPQILDLLEQHSCIVLTIQFADIERLKSALSVRKSRRTRALKDKEVPIEEQKISYYTIGEVDKDGWVKLRITLKTVTGIAVKGITIPGEF